MLRVRLRVDVALGHQLLGAVLLALVARRAYNLFMLALQILLSIAVVIGLYFAIRQVRFWLLMRRFRLRGDYLRAVAKHQYGIEPLPGESDKALRARMTSKLRALAPNAPDF
jgi:hypothetical protein